MAIAVLTSCNKDVDPAPTPTGAPISFGNVATRAGLTEVERYGFNVWAAVSSKDEASTVQYEPLLENREVVLQDGEWNYGEPENWISNSMFYFFAAYPQDTFHQQRIQEGDYKFTIYSTDVTVNGTTDTEDILVATNVTDTSEEGYATTVTLNFGHLLTKVNVKIRQNFDADPDFNYYITGVTIRKYKEQDTDPDNGAIYCDGTCIFLPYNNQFHNWWDFDKESPVLIKKEYSTPMILRNVGAADPTVNLSVWGDGLMLIPQEIASNAVEIVVDYIYDVSVDDDYTNGTPKQAKGIIPAITWEAGKSINYSLAISNTTIITFDQPTIEPWGAPQTGGTIIIK